MKLLYYFDFWHFKQTGRSVTGLRYKAWEMGPVPPTVYHNIEPKNNPPEYQEYFIVEKEEFDNGSHCLKVYPRKVFNPKIFSKRELKILEDLAYIFLNAKAKDMTDSSHLKNSPWEKTKTDKGLSEWIDFELALDDEAESITNEELEERRRLDSEFQQLFQ